MIKWSAEVEGETAPQKQVKEGPVWRQRSVAVLVSDGVGQWPVAVSVSGQWQCQSVVVSGQWLVAVAVSGSQWSVYM